MPASSDWKALLEVKSLQERKRHVKWLGDTEVMAVSTGQGIRVYSGMCPHEGGPLAEGRFELGIVTCPWHGCAFDLATGDCRDRGTCTGVPGLRLVPIPFDVREGVIFVHVPRA